MNREEAIEVVKERLDYYGREKRLKAACETLIPELAESEDERIRKWLVNYFGSIKTVWIHMDITCEQILAWLEKQKEQEHICDSAQFEEGFKTGLEIGLRKQKKQKQNSTEDMPYIADEHFYERVPADSFKYKLAEYMTKCCTKKEGPYGYTYGISAESILKMAEEELLKRGVVQKPEEWSEFDKGVLKDAICAADILGNDESFNKGNPNLGKAFRVAKDWLKSLPERFNLQTKQEWSEEDKKILDDVSHILIGLNYKQIAKDYKQAVEKLIYARPSWKPSEEQMEALNKVVNGEVLLTTQHKSLESLCEQLQKLM